jgi:polyisoprenyl-phosphate glycosyltransferase
MKLSIVIPVLNEERSLKSLCERLKDALTPLTNDFEIIFIDDGSDDDTLRWLSQTNGEDARIKCLSLSRRFGHQAALTAGLDHADGEAVICMDGDLQHPPESLPSMIRAWQNGYDIVYAIREDAGQSSLFKRVTSALFYRIFRRLTNVPLPVSSADFRLLDRRVVQALRKFRERSRFLRGISSWVGFRSTTVPYKLEPRLQGTTQYTPFRMALLAVDALISFSSMPLYLGVLSGLILAFFTWVYVLFVLYSKFISHQVLPGWTSVALLVGGIGSLQLVVVGLIGLYVAKVYEESKQRPLYLIRHGVGTVQKIHDPV